MLKAGSAARRLTLDWAAPQPGPQFAALVETTMRAIDRRLQNTAPTWVGHCKLLVSSDGAAVYASLTTADDVVRWTGTLPATLHHAEITLYAAIYALPDAVVAAALDAELPGLQQTHPNDAVGDRAGS